MRIGRTLPPAAAPITWADFVSGLRGWVAGSRSNLRFENELKDYFGVEFCFLLSSGKAALTLILQALKALHPERDEVLIPAYTCYSVPSAVVRAGLKVRLCDIHSDTLDFDFEQLGQKLKNKRLLCVVPIHLFGRPADIKRLRRMIEDPAVSIVEDAAQAFGGKSGEGKLGTLGDVGFFSLGRGKAFSTVEGGIIITSRSDIAQNLRACYARVPRYSLLEQLRLLLYATALMSLMNPAVFWLPKAVPFLRMGETIFDPAFKIRRLSSLQAGLSKGWMQRVSLFQQARNTHARELRSILHPSSVRKESSEDSYGFDLIRFPVKITSAFIRESVLLRGEHQGLGISLTYPDSVDGIAALRKEFAEEQYPVARAQAQQLVTLPIHSLLNAKDLTKIKQVVSDLAAMNQFPLGERLS